MSEKKMKICYIPYDGRELNNIAFSNKYENRWTNILKRRLEKEGHSIATYDINFIEDSDVILCFDNVYFQNNRHFKKIFNAQKLGDTIHIDYEPPSANCRIHDNGGLRKLSNLFKALITYNDDVVNGDTIVKGCIADYLEKERKYKNNFKERKFLCILANYRAELMLFGPHKDELYTQRKVAVDYFQKKCPSEFDLYGSYWPEDSQVCLRKSVDRNEKMDTISQYKFIISYDSIKNQRGYISEKIFDCFKAKVVPVYWGADNVTDYIPKECFVDKRDFETYDHLYEYLKNMTEEEYNHRIAVIEEFLQSEQYKELFSSEASATIIYNQIMRPTRDLDYAKAASILNSFEKLRLSSPKYNYDNYYFETGFNNEISSVTSELMKDGYGLKFELKLRKKFDPEIFVKVNNQFYILPIKCGKGKNGEGSIADSFSWYFFIEFKHIGECKKMFFYVRDKVTDETKKLNIDAQFYLNEINCDNINRMQVKDNILFVIKNHGCLFNLYMKFKMLRSLYIALVSIHNFLGKSYLSQSKYNYDDLWVEKSFNNRVSGFTSELIQDGYNLKFELRLPKRFDPEIFVKVNNKYVTLPVEYSEDKNEADTTVDLSTWYFCVAYKYIVECRKMCFYIRDKVTDKTKKLNIDTQLYINEINCDDINRMQAKNNMLFVIKNSGHIFNLYMKVKPLRFLYVYIKRIFH